MKAAIIGLTFLTSIPLFATDSTTKYAGVMENGGDCSLIYKMTEKNRGYPMVEATVKGNYKRGTKIETGKHWFDEQVERQVGVGGNLEYVEFEKDGMTELCDYYDICLFQKPLKTISISYDEDSNPVSYTYTTIKNWKEDAELKTLIECRNLVEVN